jgi:threonylcarbamoyladenosine tRNA methylthiotransferase MtaB
MAAHLRGLGLEPWQALPKAGAGAEPGPASAAEAGRVPCSASPGVIVVNTCSVTEEADRSARAYIRRAHREHPQARIVVTGCYAQRAPGELEAPGVAAILGNSYKARVPEVAAALAEEAAMTGQAPAAALIPVAALTRAPAVILADDHFAHAELASWPLAAGTQTRPALKIQEGCSNRCSFCVIPWTRGPSRSLAPGRILEQARQFAASGGVEMVLSGINLGRWGRDLEGGQTLAALVRRLLEETQLERLRISSVEPMDWSADMLAVWSEFARGPRFRLARHVHLPLQSGADRTLRRMHRRYRPWHYRERLQALHAAVPEAGIGADVMVGFPGETERDFAESYRFIAGLPFTYLHVFPFSPRPGTRAWELYREQPVPPAAVEERAAAMRALGEEKNRAFRFRLAGRVLSAVTLRASAAEARSGVVPALSDNFLPVSLPAPPAGGLAANRAVRVLLSGGEGPDTLLAERDDLDGRDSREDPAPRAQPAPSAGRAGLGGPPVSPARTPAR